MRSHISAALMGLVLGVVSACATQLIVPTQIRQIEDAVEKAEPGDTVFVLNGIYNEQLTMRDSVVLLGEDIQKTVIYGNGIDPVIKGADFARIQNLTVKAGSIGVLCENKRMIIDHVYVTENRQTGIHCLIGLPVIRNCIISRNKWTGIYCESVQGFRGPLEHNVFAENGYSGVMLAGKTNVVLQDNVFANNRQYGIWVSQDSRKSRIAHNSLYNNRNAFNSFALVNNTNSQADPGFAPLVPNTYDYFAFDAPSLSGLGSNSGSIGLTTSQPYDRMSPDSTERTSLGR